MQNANHSASLPFSLGAYPGHLSKKQKAIAKETATKLITCLKLAIIVEKESGFQNIIGPQSGKLFSDFALGIIQKVENGIANNENLKSSSSELRELMITQAKKLSQEYPLAKVNKREPIATSLYETLTSLESHFQGRVLETIARDGEKAPLREVFLPFIHDHPIKLDAKTLMGKLQIIEETINSQNTQSFSKLIPELKDEILKLHPAKINLFFDLIKISEIIAGKKNEQRNELYRLASNLITSLKEANKKEAKLDKSIIPTARYSLNQPIKESTRLLEIKAISRQIQLYCKAKGLDTAQDLVKYLDKCQSTKNIKIPHTHSIEELYENIHRNEPIENLSLSGKVIGLSASNSKEKSIARLTIQSHHKPELKSSINIMRDKASITPEALSNQLLYFHPIGSNAIISCSETVKGTRIKLDLFMQNDISIHTFSGMITPDLSRSQYENLRNYKSVPVIKDLKRHGIKLEEFLTLVENLRTKIGQ